MALFLRGVSLPFFFFSADFLFVEGVAAFGFEGVASEVVLVSRPLFFFFAEFLILFLLVEGVAGCAFEGVSFFGSCFLFLVLRVALGARGGRGVEGGGGRGAFLRALFTFEGVLVVVVTVTVLAFAMVVAGVASTLMCSSSRVTSWGVLIAVLVLLLVLVVSVF